MSTEQRSARTTSTTTTTADSASERSGGDRNDRDRATATADVELEYRAVGSTTRSGDRTDATATAGAVRTKSPAAADPLSHRIERTKLQARVTALERALETSEYRQHEIRTQYERLLAERTEAARDDGGSADEDERDGLLYRLLERWR